MGRRFPLLLAAVVCAGALAAPRPARADARTEARKHFQAGMALLEKGRYDAGIKELERANALLPHPNVAFNIAQAEAKAGRPEKAIAAYEQYLASEPADREEVERLVADLKAKRDQQRAGAERVAESRTHFEAGMALIGKKDYDAGIRELEEANRILPHPNVSFNIARAYAEAGKPAEAIANYETYLASGPADADAVKRIVADLKTRVETPATPVPVPGPVETSPPTPDTKPAPEVFTEKPAPSAPTPPPAARTDDVYRETVVTAARRAQSPLDAPNSTAIITRQDVQLSGITRIPELLRRVAGMDVMQITGGDANVSLRGLNARLSNKLLVLVNGRSVYNDVLGSTFWESLSIDVDQIERIEIVRGPGSALYGADAFAGVVNIITVAPGEGKGGVRAGYGDHAQAYGSAWSSGRDGDFAYRASVGYTRYPRWTKEVGDDRVDVTRANDDQDLGAENLRFDLRTSKRFGKDVTVELGGGASRSDLDIYGIGPFNDYHLEATTIDVTAALLTPNFRARAYYARLDGEGAVNSAYPGHTLYETEPVQNTLDVELAVLGTVRPASWFVNEAQLGLGYRLKNIAWDYLIDEPPIEHHASAFLIDTARFGEHVALVGSGRLDYVPYLDRLVVSPRGTLVLKPTANQAIRVSGSTAFRSPTFLESYLALPIELASPGLELLSESRRSDDPDFVLEPEQIVTAEVGYLNQTSDDFEFELGAYYNRIQDLVQLAEPREVTLSDKDRGLGGVNRETGHYTVAFGGWENRCDVLHVVGGEVAARVYPIEGLDLFANYALNVGSQEADATCAVPEDRRTSRHKVNAGVQVRTPVGIAGEVTFHWQSAQAWGEQVVTPSGLETQVFDQPAYTLVNARLGYRFYKDKIEVSGTVFNALAGAFEDAPRMHPFGNRVGRRFMGFLSYAL